MIINLQFRIIIIFFFGILFTGLNISAQEVAQPSLIETNALRVSDSEPILGTYAAQIMSPVKFIGAELAGTITNDGKLQITLQTFYDASTHTVPETEKVTVFENEIMRLVGVVELKKEKERLYDKYAPVGNTTMTLPSVKSVVYTGEIYVGLGWTSYNTTWAYAGLMEIFNNVELNPHDAIALVTQISYPKEQISNNIPILDHLPTQKVNSNSNTGYFVDAREKGEKDSVEINLTEPFIFTPSTNMMPTQGSIITEAPPFKTPKYKSGFTGKEPGAKSISYNTESKELIFDHPPFGTYLLAITISDYRKQTLLSQHQAVFIIESIF